MCDGLVIMVKSCSVCMKLAHQFVNLKGMVNRSMCLVINGAAEPRPHSTVHLCSMQHQSEQRAPSLLLQNQMTQVQQ